MHQLARVRVALAREVHHAVGRGIDDVIALVLRVAHPEPPMDVRRERMHLQGQVAATHGIEEIEPNRELRTESPVDWLAEQRAGFSEDQVDGRYLDAYRTEPQAGAVFLRNTVEAPGEVPGSPIEVADLFHPLPTPGAR